MKIIFDHQIFSSQRFGGISRYHVELIKNLDVQWDIPFFFSNNFYLKDIKTVPEFLPAKNFRGKKLFRMRGEFFITFRRKIKRAFNGFWP